MSNGASVHVRLGAAHVGRLDQIIAGQRVKPSRNEMVKILAEEAIDREAEKMRMVAGGGPSERTCAQPKPRKIVARPFPKDPPPLSLREAASAPGHEGARLKAARLAAKLTQPDLANAATQLIWHGDGAAAKIREEHVSAGKNPGTLAVSRQQIVRAERAESLEQWPALRAWLLAQEAKP